MLFSISLILLSFLTIPTLFIDKINSLESLYKKIEIYKGIIGTFYCAFGLIRLVQIILHPGLDFLYIMATLCMVVLGFLLGFQFIAKNIFSNNEEAKEKIRKVYFKLITYERILSLISLGLGVYILILKIF